MPGPAPNAYNLRGSSSVALTPSQPKEADIRQGIPAESHGHRPVTVAEESCRREDVEPGANKQRPESHEALCFPMEILPSQNWFATHAVTTETIRS